MQLTRVAGLLLAALLACWGGAPEQRLRLTEPGWDEFAARLRREPAPIAVLEKRRRETGLPLRFRVGEAADLESVVELVHDSVCGETLTAFVRELPEPNREAVGSELVLEVDSTGQVVQRWPIPVDMSVAALRGEEIYVPHAVELTGSSPLRVFLAIRPDGAFRVTQPVAFTRGEQLDCPETSELVDSAGPSRRCWVFQDGAAFRVLAYAGPCL